MRAKVAQAYLLKTTHGAARHRLAGARDEHPEVTFPVCPKCRYRHSPLLRLDFTDPKLAAMGLWEGDLVLLRCHSGCRPSTHPAIWGWDYTLPLAPKILDPSSITDQFGAGTGDYEWEEIGLEAVEHPGPDPDLADLETRVGGEPGWLQRAIDVDCLRCQRPLPLLAQWSEHNMDHVPRRLGVRTAQIMGNPFVTFWWGCAACRIILTCDQID